jgi:hypothetical protein
MLRSSTLTLFAFLAFAFASSLSARHSPDPPQCDSISSFCHDFNDKCIASCAGIHHPIGFHGQTHVQYKCQYTGEDYFGESPPLSLGATFQNELSYWTAIGCICSSTDLTSGVLSQIASAANHGSGGGSPHTTTKTTTVTRTQFSTAHALATVTAHLHQVRRRHSRCYRDSYLHSSRRYDYDRCVHDCCCYSDYSDREDNRRCPGHSYGPAD